MSLVRDIAVLVLAWAGALFVVLSAVGLLRMPDLFSRLQASSKAPTLGIALFAVALALHLGGTGVWVRAAALVLILFVTAPIAAHLIARAGFVTGVRREPATVVDPDAEPVIAEVTRAPVSGSSASPGEG